jgi:hypothetical protein
LLIGVTQYLHVKYHHLALRTPIFHGKYLFAVISVK